jgi:hypothetical protein
MRISALPIDFDSLVRFHPPAAIHDDVAYENAMTEVDPAVWTANRVE